MARRSRHRHRSGLGDGDGVELLEQLAAGALPGTVQRARAAFVAGSILEHAAPGVGGALDRLDDLEDGDRVEVDDERLATRRAGVGTDPSGPHERCEDLADEARRAPDG